MLVWPGGWGWYLVVIMPEQNPPVVSSSLQSSGGRQVEPGLAGTGSGGQQVLSQATTGLGLGQSHCLTVSLEM